VDTLIHIKLSISTTGGISDTVTLTPYIVPKGITFIESSSTGLPDFSWTFAIKVAIDSPVIILSVYALLLRQVIQNISTLISS